MDFVAPFLKLLPKLGLGIQMRKTILFLALFWPGAILWCAAGGVHFFLEERISGIVSVILIFGGAGVTHVWVKHLDRTGKYKKLAQRLKIDPREI